ncbi:hypothetical protein CO613_04405 [Lysobacteraceae bacterium NML07-0707]|nr:hypothetical protein CO613_04405 [Xanthomonadaceae bacterium NML07-0707]
MSKRVLFHRDFRQYSGGHGKVWDYFNHLRALGWQAQVYLTPQSRRDASNPWMQCPELIAPQFNPQEADLLFLAGMDWQAVPENKALPPVINLLQGMRHAQSAPALPLRDFLSNPAFRICVSQAVADAVQATGQVNGPLRVIPAALDMTVSTPQPEPDLHGKVFISAHKQQPLAVALAAWLFARGHTVDLLMDMLPRTQYLARLSQAAVVVVLPLAEEGFFLPGLEAMALGKPVVMPAAGGNLQYARHMQNCLMPLPDVESLGQAVLQLCQAPVLRKQLVQAAHLTALRFTLADERQALAAALREWGLM